MKNIRFPVTSEILEKLCQKKIFFGHQSVGFNIIAGIVDIVNDYPGIPLKILESRKINDLNKPVFAHSRIGHNTDATGKIEDFRNLISNEIGYKLEIAFLKLCYVDITAKSDIKTIFKSYQLAMENISKSYPSLKIIHWTVPLTVSKISWKTNIKKLLGKRVWECEDNIKRNQFNTLIRKTYSGRQPVFDLAQIESQMATVRLLGELIETLRPEYTDDGGHLNIVGRRTVAEQLLLFLSTL